MTDEEKKFYIKPEFGDGTPEEQIRKALSFLVKPEEIDRWLNHYNKHFEAKPIDLIKKGEVRQIWHMIYELGTGMPV